MSTVNLKENVIFEKSIIISKNEGSIQNQELTTGTVGQLRFNQTSRKFEGFHCVANSNAGADIFGNKWRPFTQDVASTSNLGIFRVGTNLTMNATTGILSSIASGESRIYQLVITVSPIVGAADYQSINTAISHAIGTPANNYTDGTLTSNLGSAPSPTYPFVIQLGPGQYSETLNKIILPDYVSLRGENNYNSVITQNHGSNGSITNASMLIVGQNSEIKNLVINLADTVSSSNTNAIYSLNKSNVVIDNCIISCSSNITTTQNTYGIFMDGGDNNSITNNKVDFNSNTLLGNLNTISITNSTPRLINNYINILAPNISISNGINLNNCIGTESISDTVYIENLTLSNNYYNTLTTSINTGIFMNNTPVILKNSDIEVSNDPSLTTNYGIQFKSVPNLLANPLPYAGNTTSNVISFVNVTNGINIGQNLINSSNTSALNFLTANYQRGQYVNVSGSSSNNGIYKIASLTSSSLTLENGFNLISEAKTALNTITLKGLFDMNIYNTRINGSTNSIKNNNNNSNYICNLYDIINETGAYSISPSFVFYRNYKTLTVGKVNCDFNNLYNAMTSISDNNSMTRYLIKIQSGIYHETSYITCKEFVDIEGNGEDNTILQFYQAANTSGTPMNTTSCILLCSNITIKNITIKNSPTLYTAGQTTSTVFYNPNTIVNLILENLIINSTCSSVYNKGIYIVNGSSLILRNIDLVIYSTNTAEENTGITAKECNTFNLYNISSTIDSGFSLVSHALHLTNSSCNIYNPNFLTHSAVNYNSGVYSYSTNTTQKLIQIYNGQIRSYDAIEYSIYTDNYYTIMCNGAQLLGDTFENSISSHLYCNSCYTFTDENDKTNIQSLNSRGQNEQSSLTYSSLTIGDTAGKRNATGTNNVFVGVDSGSNVTTASNNTFLGYNTGKTLNIAGNNTLIGSSVGQSITTGTGNTITGSNAGINLSTGNTNTITGAYAGKELTTGFGNTINGTSSGLTLTTGFRNTFMGDGSGLSTNTSFFNTFIGSLSGYDNNSGNNNTYLGYQSGYEGISSNNNVFIGTASGYTNQSSNIVALGAQSGYNNTSSIKNTYIGHQSGYNNVTGDCNTYLGYNAGYSAASASGDFNIAIGNEAGYSITSGARNVLIGSTKNATSGSNDAAGWSLQDGTDNIHIGVNTGSQATSAINNVFIGSDIGTSITTASNNILIGKNTGNSITNNDGNIIIGSETGNDNTYGNALIIGQNSGVGHTGSPAFVIGHNAGKNIEGVNNMFIGQSSGGISQTGKTGNYNLAIGPFSGFNLKAGSRNIIVGTGDSLSSAGGVITSGSDNTLLGFNSGRAVQTGVGNTLIGSNAGANLTSGANNLILGYKSAYTLGTGSNNISLGPEAGYNLTGGNGNIFSGYRAGYNTTSGFNNINIGVQSGYQSQTTRNNIHIGYQSGYQSIANNNLFLGSYSGLQNTTGIDNIFVGSNSGAGYNTSSQQIGNYNIFMGSDTGKSNFDGTRNIYLGLNSGKNNINGSKNVYIGENTGRDSVVSRNIFIGTTSDNTKGVGYKAQSAGGLDTGDKNVFIGHDVGIENTSGKGNIFLGDSAGQKNTTGEQNIYIGKNAGNKANASTADYNIALGYNSGQNNLGGKENILIGKEVASITTNSYNQNIIIGSEAGQYINQDNQIFIGTKAGQNNTTGDNNIFIGKDAGKANSISNDNVVIGSDAGTFIVGNGLIGDNTIIGANAAHDLTTGTNNIYIGSSAGLTAVSSINNVVIGTNSMSNGDANNVVIIGNNAGQNNTANANIFIGSNAGVQNTTGIGNIFIGIDAGKDNINSNDNVVIGSDAGISLIGSGLVGANTIIGSNAAHDLLSGINNIFLGTNSGSNAVASINNVVIGANSMSNGEANNVVIIGNNAGKNNTANANIFIGSNAGVQNTIGLGNIFIGSNTGAKNISSTNNLIIGNDAGKELVGQIDSIVFNVENTFNTWTVPSNIIQVSMEVSGAHGNYGGKTIADIAGFGAKISTILDVVPGSQYNICIGASPLPASPWIGGLSVNGYGGGSTFYSTLGFGGGGGGATTVSYVDISSNVDIIISGGGGGGTSGSLTILPLRGGNAGINQLGDGGNGTTNIYYGIAGLGGAGGPNILGNPTVGGNAAGTMCGCGGGGSNGGGGGQNLSATGGAGGSYVNTSIINNYTISTDTTGISQVKISYIKSNIVSTNNKGENILIGNKTGQILDTGINNIFIGSSACLNSTTSINSIAIGTNCMKNGNANNVILIGNNAGLNNVADNNIFIGSNAGVSSRAVNNIGIGVEALYKNKFSGNNICIGNYAGYNYESDELTANNVYIGTRAGYNNITGGANLAIGPYALENATQNGNMGIGGTAGQNITTGVANLLIGYNAGINLTTGNFNTVLYGSLLGPTSTRNAVIGFSTYLLGTGSRNTMLGSFYTGAYNINGNDNVYIGDLAGNIGIGSRNTYLGAKCGQNNTGNNNIFIGYEETEGFWNYAPDVPLYPSSYSNKYAIYKNTGAGIGSETGGSFTILIGGDFTTGTVGIGTLAPDSWISPSLAAFTSTKLVVLGYCRASAHTTFTGAHNVNIDNTININELKEGFIMSSTGNTIKSGISETTVTVKLSSISNDKTVYGVFSGIEIVSNNNIDTIIYYVNSLGEGCILVSNYGGEIQNGDYITTCPISGYGSLQSDDILHSYTVAKCTENIDWNLINETVSYNGQLYKVVLTSCTYHCG